MMGLMKFQQGIKEFGSLNILCVAYSFGRVNPLDIMECKV